MAAHAQPHLPRPPVDAGATDWVRGAVAALQRPLAAAEAALVAGDYALVVRHLRPAMRDFGARLGSGRPFELWGACGAEGLGGIAPLGALTQALAAYQDAHDVLAMGRCHHALGELALGRGELIQAEREFGYAAELFARRGNDAAQVASLVGRAYAALQQAATDRALAHADLALQACQKATWAADVAGAAAAEAHVRLVRAQAATYAGKVQVAAREMLWAEHLLEGNGVRDRRAPPPAAPTPASQAGVAAYPAGRPGPAAGGLDVVLCRTDSLLTLGHPRRAAALWQRSQAAYVAPRLGPQRAAHALRLEGEVLVADAPQRALGLLQEAQQRYLALGQPYWRVRCEVGLVRAAHRTGSASLRPRLEALGHVRLQRWPVLLAALEHAKAELARPAEHVPGSVRAPWMAAVGHQGQHHVGQVAAAAGDDRDRQRAADLADAGLLDRLQGAWGRLLGQHV